MQTIKNENGNHPELLHANSENVEITFNKIRDYANLNGYRIVDSLKIPTNLIGLNKSLNFDSDRKRKVLRNYINRLNKRMSVSTLNAFLNFLFKKIYKMEACPRVLISEKEVKIQQARKAWKKAQAETEKLRIEYRTEKGDFYKKK